MLSLFSITIMPEMGKRKQQRSCSLPTLTWLLSTDEEMNGSSLLVCAGCEARQALVFLALC